MGIQDSGPFGGFYKKIGPIVGRRRKGQHVLTALHHVSNKAPTEAQLLARERFSLLTGLLNQIAPLLNSGFKRPAKGKTAVNAAYTFNFERATAIAEGHYELVYPMLVVSRGHISGPAGALISLISDTPEVPAMHRGVRFSWRLQEQSLYCRAGDLASILICNATKTRAIYSQNAAERSALGFIRLLPSDFSTGDLLHCYLSFSSADGKLSGNSAYIGSLVI